MTALALCSFKRQTGFTLLELLLVVAIGAVAVAGVAVAIPPASERQINQEAERLAALLEAGRARSRASGEPVIFRTEGRQFQFEGAQTRQTLPTSWLYPDSVAEPVQLILGPEPVIQAQQVRIQGRDGSWRKVSTNGVHPFSVATQ